MRFFLDKGENSLLKGIKLLKYSHKNERSGGAPLLFTRPCQYAIRALAHLATHRGGPLYCQAQEIAQAEAIPGPFLAGLLQELARGGLVKSYKGPRGGFCLARPAEGITLYQIMEAVGSLTGLPQCAIGLEECSGDMLCPLHDEWQQVRQRLVGYLQEVTVADMAAALARKKARAARGKAGRSKPPSGAK